MDCCASPADLLGVPVRRRSLKETTALGAAYLAGLQRFVVSRAEAASSWSEETVFTPLATEEVERQSEQGHRASTCRRGPSDYVWIRYADRGGSRRQCSSVASGNGADR